MKWLIGRPTGCEGGGTEFVYRGVPFTVERGGGLWGCAGFKSPRLADTLCSVQRDDGWNHLRRNATIRSVCRSITAELRRD